MADCELLDGGLPKDCSPNIGGLFTTMWITELSNITSFTPSSPGSQISAINMVSPSSFYPFQFNKGTSSYAESQTFDEATGNSLVTDTITLQLNKREQTKKDKIVLLGNFKEMCIITKDSNGKYVLHGRTGGCILKTNEGGSGVAKTDGNNYILTFIAEEGELADEVTEAAVLAVI
jgi:hypothetical protein